MSSTGDPKNVLHHKSRVHLDAKQSALNRTKDQTHRPTRLSTSISKKAPAEDALGTRPKQEPYPSHFLYSGASINSIGNGSKNETASVKPAVSEIDTPLEDRSKQFNKSWIRGDRRQASRSSIRHSDGPRLQAKSNWIPSLRVRRSSAEEPRFSYAQAVSASHAVPQRSTLQTSPAWAILPSSSSMKSRSSLDPSILLESATESDEGDSSAPPSVFDGESDSDEHHSDPETDMSSLSISEYALPPDLERDDRLVNPQQYFAELEGLEANVAGNSGLFLLSRNNRQLYPKGSEFSLKFSFGSCTAGRASTTNRSYDDQILSYCKPQNGYGPVARNKDYEMTSADLSYWAFHLLECRNLMLAVVANLERMNTQRYCGDFISILVLDDRRADVVKLQRIGLDTINAIHESFELAVEQVAHLIESPRAQRSSRIIHIRDRISQQCSDLLLALGLPQSQLQVGTWRRAVLVLDLAIVSYCGTHTERFDQRYLEEDLDFATVTPAWTYDTSVTENIMLRRRKLRCLNRLLDSKIWVFQSQAMWQDQSELYLSTNIADLADVWGPVWSVMCKSALGDVSEYRFGSGTLVPSMAKSFSPNPEQGEILCHWSPAGDRNSEPCGAMSTNARLLIGAATIFEQTTSQLKESPDCTSRTNKVLQELRSMHCAEELGTSTDERILTEECVVASVGYSGLTLGGQKTYKRQSGVTLKQAICEEWQNNSSSRNPAILEHWIGLEVSFCSGNARRRRLKEILKSKTMTNWLESCQTNSEPSPCETAFRNAVESRDPRAFSTLWNQHREWRKDLGQLVAWCLEGLAHSKVDSEGNLHLLWMPQTETRWIVKLKHGHHTWTSFLADSRDHCAMAVMSGKCLNTDYKYASTCQNRFTDTTQKASSVLETSLVINAKATRPKTLEKRSGDNEKSKQARWSISNLQSGERFQLASVGLRVIEPFARTRLLVHWEGGMAKTIQDAKQQMAKKIGIQSYHHWEMRDQDDWPTKPIPLFIVSRYKFSCK